MSARILFIFLIAFISEVNGQSFPYTMQADINVLLGDGVRPVPAIRIFNGIRLDRNKIETGLTVGVDIYSQLNILPVSGSLKWTPISQRKLMPYGSINVGYGLAWLNQGKTEKDYQGGFVFNPSLGVRIKTSAKARMNLGLGFNHQRAGIVYKSFDGLGKTISETLEKYKFGRVAINFGIGF